MSPSPKRDNFDEILSNSRVKRGDSLTGNLVYGNLILWIIFYFIHDLNLRIQKKKVSEPTPKGDSSSPGEAGTDQQDEHANGQDATQGKGETEKIDWRSQRIVGSVTDARGTSRKVCDSQPLLSFIDP